MTASGSIPVEWLHQIAIGAGDGHVGRAQVRRLPRAFEIEAQAARGLYPEARYRLWEQHQIRPLLRSHFDPDVLQAFDALQSATAKQVFSRYCILFVLGGIYLDLPIRLLTRWDPMHEVGIAAFRADAATRTSWTDMHTGLLWSRPGRQEWLIAIDGIVARHRSEQAHEPNEVARSEMDLGWAFASAVAAQGPVADRADQWVGEIRRVPPGHLATDLAFVTPEGRVVGLRLAPD